MQRFYVLLYFSIIFSSLLKAQTYTEVSNSIGINHVFQTEGQFGGGVAFFDYDNDGDDDLYLTGGDNRDFLYKNNGNGTFTEVGIQAGLGITGDYFTCGITTGDIENDGDRDLFITTYITRDSIGFDILHNNRLFVNNGNGTFTDNTIAAGIVDTAAGLSSTFGDFNKDGFLDIYVNNYVESDGPIFDSLGGLIGVAALGYPNFYYVNNGNGTFTQMAPSMNLASVGNGLAVAATDFDNDNDVDIHVVNDFGQWNVPNELYQNNYPTHSFTDVSIPSGANIGMFGMGIAVGDYNEDLFLDYYITNVGENKLLINNTNGTFTDTSAYANVENKYAGGLLTTGWGAAFFDYNNDTYLDLFVANGIIDMPQCFPLTATEDPNKLYHNNGNGTFTDTTDHFNLNALTVAHGMAYSDYDQDGDIDIAVAVISYAIPSDSMPQSLLYRNDSIGFNNNWVQVKLEGTVSNKDAFGAHVLVHAAGRTFLREVDGGSSHASQNSSVQHVGLGNINTIDSIVVIWPNTGSETFINLGINQKHLLIEGNITSFTTTSKEQNEIHISPNPTNSLLNITLSDPNAAPIKLNLYNALGQSVYQKNLNYQSNITLPMHALDLSSGIFLLQIEGYPSQKIRYIKN